MAYRFCSRCSVLRPPDARFCPNCGDEFAKQDAALPEEWDQHPPIQPAKAPSRFLLATMAAFLALAVIAGGLGYFLSHPSTRKGGYPIPPTGTLPTPLPTPTGPVALTYRFVPRSTVVYLVRSRVDGTITYQGGSPHTVHRQIDASIRMTVMAVDPHGVATIRVRVERVSDSLARLDEAHLPRLGAMKVAPDGSILRGSGLGLLASGLPDVWVPGLEQIFPVLPSRPVAPGDHWNFEVAQPFGLRFRITFLRWS
jgi:hypothetical protein